MQDISACKLSKKFDVSKLKTEINKIDDDLWRPVIRDKGLAWSGIALRSHDGSPTSLQYKDTSYNNTEVLESSTYLQEVVEFFRCDLLRVRILKITPNSEIGEHTDSEEGSSEARLHIPVISNKNSKVVVDDEKILMSEGSLWYVDVAKPHSVYNYGKSDRIHIVVDCVVNKWLKYMLQ